MSYREKSIFASMIISLYILFCYLTDLIEIVNADHFNEATISALFIKIIVMTIILEVVSQTIIAIINHKEADDSEDERDKLINLKASKWSYNILSATTISTILLIWFCGVTPDNLIRHWELEDIASVYVYFVFLLTGLLVAESTKYIGQIYYYRKGF